MSYRQSYRSKAGTSYKGHRHNVWLSRAKLFPKFLLLPILLLCTISCLLIYSTSIAVGSYDNAMKQFYAIIIAIIVFYCAAIANISLFYKNSHIIYTICLILLLVADFIGHSAMGAQRWLRFGYFNLQPAEFMKIGMILSMARIAHKVHNARVNTQSNILTYIILTILPAFLLLRQPNLGSTMVLLYLFTAIIFVIGVRLKFFIYTAFVICLCAPFIWHNMHSYQKSRVMTFLYPEADPLGAGYNIIQSKIAIGSGGIYGKGLFMGTQTQYNFLPEKHTDFIFTVLAEEFGLIGVLAVSILYLFLIVYTFAIAMNIKHQFGRIVVMSVNSMLLVHLIMNLGMVSGMLPVVGVPLPFLSYGRSNLICMFMAYGLVANMHINAKSNLT